ncbi:MAG: hypothetical protein KF730_10040 [Sphingomonas sp.]|uniref:hypothetical protein n=1 Tax=Sphingomonas sp. TaxID=28214 RepID=UPI0025CE57FD|nr:hypothetical protein [Sphingomonas sp.]MBX3564902.1 hypothetical protein [Sphingomonas sp.]
MSFKKLIAAAALAVAGIAGSAGTANAAPVAPAHAGASALTMSLAASPQRWDRHNRYDRGRHHGWDRRHYNRRHYNRRVCRTEWRHHRRVTVCYRR